MNTVRLTTTSKALFGAFTLFALAACGGGGGGDSSASPSLTSSSSSSSSSSSGGGATSTPAGIWKGTTDQNQSIIGIVLDNNAYYILYTGASSSSISGVVQGTLSYAGGGYSSSNAKDFNISSQTIYSPTVSGSYTAKSSFNGRITYSSSYAANYTANYDATYESAAQLSNIVGTYSGSFGTGTASNALTVTIDANGNVSSNTIMNCTVSGTIKPRGNVNVFDVNLAMNGSQCYYKGQIYAGVGYYDSSKSKFYVAAPNADRTDGILFVATH